MKTIFLLISIILVSLVSFSQTSGKAKIVLKDKTVVNNVKVWNIYSNKVEYEENESLHDLLTERIARIETDSTVLSFDESGLLFSRPYDWIIKTNDDTLRCIISQLGGNYIYYYLKGRETRSYLPETSVKKYQVFKPEPGQKLEAGSATFSTQVSSPDTSKISAFQSTPDPVHFSPDSAKSITIPQISEKQETDTAKPKAENNTNEKIQKESTPLPRIPEQNDLCYDSYVKGERDANGKSESIWGTGSFCFSSSCITFGLPSSIMTLIALNSKQKPKVIPEGVDERCYSLGFKNQQTKRRVYNTTIGGLVSSVVILGIVYTSIVLNNGM